MLKRIYAIPIAMMLIAGCHNSSQPDHPVSTITPVTVSGVYRITGGIAAPGDRSLKQGETVSMALAENITGVEQKPPFTIVLVRQCPEGKTRELIDVNRSGQLMESKQDYVLRDGDELILPTSTSTAPSSITRPGDVPPRH